MPAFQAHTARFFVPEPKAVHCMALDNGTKKLAVSRSDNSVELWDVSCVLSQRGAPVCQVRLPPSGGASVEALAWSGGRLFSTGLHGHVLEHGGHGLEATASTAVTGGAAWCMAAEPAGRRLAAGTEDGQVVIHTVTDQGLLFDRRLAKQERRILCVAWSPDGSHLATGSVNTVCLHHTKTGAQMSRITVGRQAGRKETLVWSVALLSDLTIVTGDSRGRVSFWNGPLGALHVSLNSHRGDVLAVAASEDGGRVFAAGVDPTVARFERVPGARAAATSWVRSLRVQLHVRDVRVLLGVDDWLISAGVDAALVFDLQGSNRDTIRTSPLPQLGTVLPAPSLPGLMTTSDSGLRLWRLPTAAGGPEQPTALLQLSCRRGEPLVGAALSADAGWLAYSTPSRLRLHRLDTGAARPTLHRVRSLPPAADVSARQMAFSPDASWLLLLTAAGRLVQLWLTAQNHDEFRAEDLGWADGRDSHEEEDGDETSGALDLLTLSGDGRRAALADRTGGVLVWDLEQPAVTARLPRHSAPAAALAFRPGHSSCVLTAYADRSVSEYDTEAAHLTAWARWAAQHVPDTWRHRPLPVRHMCVSDCGSRLILHDDSGVCALDAAAGEEAAGEKKRAKTARGRRRATDVEESASSDAVVITDKYRHLLYLGIMGGNQLLAVEAPAIRVEETLPPALRRKRYGVA